MREPEWITAREAARRLEVNVTTFLALAGSSWPVRRRELPDFPTRWHAGDVARLMASAVKSGPRTEKGQAR